MTRKIEIWDQEIIQDTAYDFYCAGILRDSMEFECVGCDKATWRIIFPLADQVKCPTGRIVFERRDSQPQPVLKQGLEILDKDDQIWTVLYMDENGDFLASRGAGSRYFSSDFTPYLEPGQPVFYKQLGYFIKKMEIAEEGFYLYHLVKANWAAKGTAAVVRQIQLPTEKQLRAAGFDPDKWWCI